MPRPPRLASFRGLRIAAVAVVPVVVALSVPAAAAPGVAVTPAAEGCGVVVAVSGLGEGSHTAVIRTTVLSSGDAVPVVLPVEATPAPEPTAPAPVLSLERTLTADGEVVVVLDAAAVPDADPRVSVVATVDGAASPAVELALPGCGAPPVGEPSPTPTPTAPPTPSVEPPAPAEPPVEPVAPSLPTPEPTSPTPVLPTPSATQEAPTASPSPSPSPSATGAPSIPSGPAPASPVLNGTPAPQPTPAVDVTLEQAYGAFDLGTGTSGYLSLMSFTAAPQLDAAPAPEPVPAPVIAPPEGSAAGVVAAPQDSGTRFEDVLPDAPAASDDEAVTAQLAAPELTTGAAADPLVDLAPAAFVLSASLGGLLMAGRRRAT